MIKHECSECIYSLSCSWQEKKQARASIYGCSSYVGLDGKSESDNEEMPVDTKEEYTSVYIG